MKSEGRNPNPEGRPKSEIRKVLVCFAVKEEARTFRRLIGERREVEVILVGVGKKNAERAIRGVLAKDRPGLVLSCGFAGGLRPDLVTGTAIFAADPETGLEPALLAAGAKPARFHCADRVVATAEDKRALREATGADAVEMESEAVCAACREHKIPCGTVRVVLDTAQEDLPLDFNQLMTTEQKFSHRRLALALMRRPGKAGALLRLQRQARTAAEKLGQLLVDLLLKPAGNT